MPKSHDPAASPPVPAVCLQSTYFQSIRSASAAPTAYSPNQSFGVGLPTPLQLTLTLPPGPTLLGLALRLADPLAARVAVAVLVPASVLVGAAAAVAVAVLSGAVLVEAAAAVRVGALVGSGVLLARAGAAGMAVSVGCLVLVLVAGARVAVFVAARAGVFVAWAPTDVDAVRVGVEPGASSAAAKGAGDDRQA
jgi:hypothetical protein